MWVIQHSWKHQLPSWSFLDNLYIIYSLNKLTFVNKWVATLELYFNQTKLLSRLEQSVFCDLNWSMTGDWQKCASQRVHCYAHLKLTCPILCHTVHTWIKNFSFFFQLLIERFTSNRPCGREKYNLSMIFLAMCPTSDHNLLSQALVHRKLWLWLTIYFLELLSPLLNLEEILWMKMLMFSAKSWN